MEELLKDESIDLEGDNEIVDREQERREREDKMLELKKKAERVSFFSYTPPSLLQISVYPFSALPFAHLHPALAMSLFLLYIYFLLFLLLFFCSHQLLGEGIEGKINCCKTQSSRRRR